MLFACVVAACDPMWGVRVQLRDPANRPIQDATLALACSSSAHGRVTRTDSDVTCERFFAFDMLLQPE
jgi:hypothetical protein